MTVRDLKAKFASIGYTGDYWLQSGGRALQDDTHLSEYNISSNSEIFAFYRVHGGENSKLRSQFV